MYVITDARIIECPSDRWEFVELAFRTDQYRCPPLRDQYNAPVRPSTIKTEAIKGRRFTTEDGREICLGLSKKFSDIIGFSFDQLGHLEHANHDLQTEQKALKREIKLQNERISNLNCSVSHYKNMSFWQRLKFLFKKRGE